MNEAEMFYLQRDSCIAIYLHGKAINQTPIHVFLDSRSARSVQGQGCVLSLANQLCRVHRNVTFILPDLSDPLVVPALFSAQTLAGALVQTARHIDPYGCFDAVETGPRGNAISLGIGESLAIGLDWYVGASGALARLDRAPCPLDTAKLATMRGAALASCLGASALFRTALEQTTRPRVLSCWNYEEGGSADPGPMEMPELDVGRTLMVGVGAVGAALIYWLHLFGVQGTWTLVDGDLVELKNTSRQLLYFPSDAGWFGAACAYKAQVAARFLPSCQSFSRWYHDCEEIKNLKFDTVLALANEHDVRTCLARRNPAVLLHATTGENWLSELHRHVLGTDDCIQCRMDGSKIPRLGCSTSALPSGLDTNVSDAALPFISAASGLMLATALQRLHSGELEKGRTNNWRWYFDSPYKMTSAGQRRCREGCSIVPPSTVCRSLNENTRWGVLIS